MQTAVIRVSEDLVASAKDAAEAELRSVPKQIEYWARLGQELERRRRAMELLDPTALMLSPTNAKTPPGLDLGDPASYEALPGASLIAQGFHDAMRGRQTVNSLLLSMGKPRLARLGVEVPLPDDTDAGLQLYALLQSGHGNNAHARYLALVERLTSFADALACATL